jgi:hypothetical protein
MERELALEKARVLIARGDPKKALMAIGPVIDSTEWPFGTDARLVQVQALIALGHRDEAMPIAAREKEMIVARGDRLRDERLRAILGGKTFAFAGDAIKAHLRLADRAQREANTRDALEHYRAARVLLEAGVKAPM